MNIYTYFTKQIYLSVMIYIDYEYNLWSQIDN